jgi:hypothetical protein
MSRDPPDDSLRSPAGRAAPAKSSPEMLSYPNAVPQDAQEQP